VTCLIPVCASLLLLLLKPRLLRRLTQNVVDCFGVSGVEGVYKKCAEVTLQVGCLGTRGCRDHVHMLRHTAPCLHS
jgi:hypothetical protein